ncbi:hypothetical protein [Sphingomonas guangdongensis]|uniref:hypothetical protein n=1 Tax=Sphingomonas guangdongensis TaxID=1141890 RepID=UPI0015CA3FE1|nr:hypothetical protein [Sphingomonas guangdongensis]
MSLIDHAPTESIVVRPPRASDSAGASLRNAYRCPSDNGREIEQLLEALRHVSGTRQ